MQLLPHADAVSLTLMSILQAAAVIRERALGAVTGSADFHADVTTEQQKALSGVTKLGRQDWVNARLNRRAGQSQEATDSGNSAVSDVALEVTEDHFNSSAQFLDPGKAKSQADPMTAAKTAAVRNTGGLLKQVKTSFLINMLNTDPLHNYQIHCSFADPGKANPQADTMTAAKTATVRNTGGLLKRIRPPVPKQTYVRLCDTPSKAM